MVFEFMIVVETVISRITVFYVLIAIDSSEDSKKNSAMEKTNNKGLKTKPNPL